MLSNFSLSERGGKESGDIGFGRSEGILVTLLNRNALALLAIKNFPGNILRHDMPRVKISLKCWSMIHDYIIGVNFIL